MSSINKRSNRSRKSSKRNSKKTKEELISIDTFAWCDAEGFRLDINDPITQEEYNDLFNRKEICSICLEEFNKLRCIVKISCKHFFHGKCIFLYMLKKRTNFTCPICKGDLDIVWPED